ncbi:MAG TPA: hypothetical protein VGZ22_21330 [Isosphaeraceae bacterium]|jgi:hypothetical protein|nr:hypothetical protein [Isosphaeraceae bacterium]
MKRITLLHVVAAIALIGLIAWMLGAIGVSFPLGVLGVFLILFVAVPTYVLREIVPVLRGESCPGCGAEGFERLSVVPFGARYYRCRECGLRCKRLALGTWEDAKDPEDAVHFQPKGEETKLVIEPWREGDNQPGSEAIDSLVRNQRHRHEDDRETFRG